MLDSRRRARAGLGLAFAVGVTTSSALPAHASTDGCPVEYYYKYGAVSNSYRDATSVNPVYGQAGVRVGITLTQGKSVTGTVGGAISGEVSAVVAGAKAEVSSSIALTKTASVQYTGSFTIPATWTNGGYLHVGGYTKKMTWYYANTTPTCGERINRSGTANLPTSIPAYWTTRA
jgi:hypothetical protein